MPDAPTKLSFEDAALLAGQLKEALSDWHFGSPRLLETALASVISNGHLLIQSTPGLGKTRLARGLAAILGLDLGRIQCTPDLMPGDITGSEVLDSMGGKSQFRFVKGPVFNQLLLADEINRATPRTQAALLEAMQEQQVTCGETAHALPNPFLVVATQNPIELEGTYPLPEAQLDRFHFQLDIDAPDTETLMRILQLQEAKNALPEPLVDSASFAALQTCAKNIVVSDELFAQLARFIRATDPSSPNAPDEIKQHIRLGISPRGGQATLAGAQAFALLRGRPFVSPKDLEDALFPALRHRLILHFEARVSNQTADSILRSLLKQLPFK